MVRPNIFLVLGLFAALVSSTAAVAQSCTNGEALYKKTTPSVQFSCSDSNCHGPQVDKKNIQNAASNPGLIDLALDGVEGNAEMIALDLRNELPLTQNDLVDIAEYIFFYGAIKKCPTVTPASVSATPSSLAFGNVNVGSTSSGQVVTVTNTGGTTSGNVTFPAAPAGFSKSGGCTNGTFAPGASCTLTFVFNPSAAGNVNATYTIGGSVSIPISLSGTGVSVSTTPNVNASPTSLAFGSVNVGSTSAAQTVTVTNSGTAAATNMSYPAAPTGYGKGGTCSSATLAAGASCTLTFTFSPTAAGASNATYTLTGGGKTIGIALAGTGTSASGAASLSATPTSLSFGDVAVGSTSSTQTVTLSNTGGAAAAGIAMSNGNPTEFVLTSNTCGTSLAAGATCTLGVAYRPASAGSDGTTITFTYTGGGLVTVALSGNGTTGAPSNPATATAYEYYHAAFDHYFVTSIADEITKLNNGTFVGWAATGRQFKVYTGTGSNLSKVCRFFSTAFDPKSSHFYTALDTECITVKANPSWQFEGDVFFLGTPDAAGNCAAGTVPVYRLYNDGRGEAPNHRLTTDIAARTEMIAKGWTPEGYGIGVTMCAPQ